MSCKGCAYAVMLSGVWCCDYLGITGHRRPCPAGEGCMVRVEGDRDSKRVWKETVPMKGRSWDTTKARALYEEGHSDGEIAKKLGTTRNAVAFWRRKQGLQANRERQKAAKAPTVPLPSLEASSPNPSPLTERPLALLKARGQVELSVELNGCVFALRAPDLAGAAWAYEYAGHLLEDMRKGLPAEIQRSDSGGERRKEWSGRSPRRQAGTEQSGISSDEENDPSRCKLEDKRNLEPENQEPEA